MGVHSVSAEDRVKYEFLASITHSIRTPLSGIIGMTDLLRETSLTVDQQEYVESARVCAEHLLETLSTTLEYSALAEGPIQLEKYEFTLVDAVNTAAEDYRTRARAKSLKFLVTVDSELPKVVVGDPRRLRQIASQLISNAVKFTENGAVEVRLEAEAGNGLRLVVHDTGKGISKSDLNHLFEVFQNRSSTNHRSDHGLGIGLAVVAKLTKAMGGTVDVETSLGTGSVFTVHLPLTLPSRTPSKSPAEARHFAVLAVEDDAIARTLLKHALKTQPVDITFAVTGEEALRCASSRRFDLILMDLQLPDADGLVLTDSLRGLPGYADVPVIALTANDSDEYRGACRERGMQAFLGKPVQARALVGTVRRFLCWPGGLREQTASSSRLRLSERKLLFCRSCVCSFGLAPFKQAPQFPYASRHHPRHHDADRGHVDHQRHEHVRGGEHFGHGRGRVHCSSNGLLGGLRSQEIPRTPEEEPKAKH